MVTLSVAYSPIGSLAGSLHNENESSSSTFVGRANVSLSWVSVVTKKIYTRRSEMLQKPYTTWGWPLFMAFIRLPLILLGSGAIITLPEADLPIRPAPNFLAQRI